MVEIKYLKSRAGIVNCFELLYYLRDYIPREFFEKHEDGIGAELYFYIRFLNYYGLFDCKKEHYHHNIGGCSYDCFWNGIPFKMVYDEDYDFVSFSVNEQNLIYKEQIAEYIKKLIENKEYLDKLKLD